jgi:hypothetical protein
MEYDPSLIEVSDENYEFEVDGREMVSAAQVDTRTGRIKLFAQHTFPETLPGTLAHEIEHCKFDYALHAAAEGAFEAFNDTNAGRPARFRSPTPAKWRHSSYRERRLSSCARLTPMARTRKTQGRRLYFAPWHARNRRRRAFPSQPTSSTPTVRRRCGWSTVPIDLPLSNQSLAAVQDMYRKWRN